VTDVQQIEAAVGENEPLTFVAQPLRNRGELIRGHNFILHLKER
jgi:hypothetical protein